MQILISRVKIKKYLCSMAQRKKNTAYFLLILYMVVLAHNSIVHNYDCEILHTLFSHTQSQPCYSHEKAVTAVAAEANENRCHINIFTNDVNVDIRKIAIDADGILPAMIVDSSPRTSDYSTRKYPSFPSWHYSSPCASFFPLRSPPLV